MSYHALRVPDTYLLAAILGFAFFGRIEITTAQMANWSGPAGTAGWRDDAAMRTIGWASFSTGSATLPTRGPLARLVRNPSPSPSLPPFALTDQHGSIQRYVEPVPGIDLEPYVDGVVIVRHDTGRTLLASQLELPPQPLVPLIGESRARRDVEPTQFLDNDDATVQLLPEGKNTSSEAPQNPTPRTPAPEAIDTVSPQEELPSLPSSEKPPPIKGTMDRSDDSTLGDSPMLGEYSGEWDAVGPCPVCGRFHASAECESPFPGGWELSEHSRQHQPARLFADVEFNFLRTHLNAAAIGKLSEKYEFSPRVIVGFRETGWLDARARFWRYDHETAVLNGTRSIQVQFDVLDIEGTHLFPGHRSEILLAGGLRIASIDLTDDDNDRAGADLVGMTLAAEARTWLSSFQGGYFTLVYGGRLSVLGGDWGTEMGSDFLPGLTQDDNVVVHELLAGIDYIVYHHNYDLHARLAFEMQNWHSDALAPDSIGVIGPGIQFGVEF
jgi:hypothetical protein